MRQGIRRPETVLPKRSQYIRFGVVFNTWHVLVTHLLQHSSLKHRAQYSAYSKGCRAWECEHRCQVYLVVLEHPHTFRREPEKSFFSSQSILTSAVIFRSKIGRRTFLLPDKTPRFVDGGPFAPVLIYYPYRHGPFLW